ncbi:unnamed protein product [Trichogramma brassicae]|uniref:Uncharacterized protein n=1 Tax=Trichogramma brassicae TaxID=86971 RepID=A0A6H5J3S0_9HYME|nr:unnamed protein product [Trichogramma brassicae]
MAMNRICITRDERAVRDRHPRCHLASRFSSTRSSSYSRNTFKVKSSFSKKVLLLFKKTSFVLEQI